MWLVSKWGLLFHASLTALKLVDSVEELRQKNVVGPPVVICERLLCAHPYHSRQRAVDIKVSNGSLVLFCSKNQAFMVPR